MFLVLFSLLMCFLAHLVMSLFNHALSGMCHCHWHHPCLCLYLHLHWCPHLHTAVPVTALIIETLYLTNICTVSLVFAHKIFCHCDSLCGSPVYLVKLRASIFGSVMHLYWGYVPGRNYATADYILETINLKFFHILHFMAYLVDLAKIQIGTHIHRHRYTQIHIQTQILIPCSHFSPFGSFGITHT